MPRSMTGFGRATRPCAAGEVTVEARSVNHRFLKVQARTPSWLEGFDAEVEARVRGRLARGAVTVSVDFKATQAALPANLDAQNARASLDRLQALWGSLFPQATPPEPARLFEILVRLPSPAGEKGSENADDLRRAAGEALDAALDALAANRDAEGSQTAADLDRHADGLAGLRAAIAARAPHAVRAVQTRFVERINQLLADARPGTALDADALLKESALFADRADISEELNRLEGHLARFHEVIRGDGEAGRRLEFLLQEMGREANTIGSKSVDLAISHAVVELKAAIEKMREQVQNLE